MTHEKFTIKPFLKYSWRSFANISFGQINRSRTYTQSKKKTEKILPSTKVNKKYTIHKFSACFQLHRPLDSFRNSLPTYTTSLSKSPERLYILFNIVINFENRAWKRRETKTQKTRLLDKAIYDLLNLCSPKSRRKVVYVCVCVCAVPSLPFMCLADENILSAIACDWRQIVWKGLRKM